MSGHSKWAQIKHKKAATDAKRGNLFGKLSRAITIAAKDGADPTVNIKLRLAIERARSFNLPTDNVERAVAKTAGDKNVSDLVSVLYEAYAPGGAALLIEGVTDNKNRATAEIKHILLGYGGKFAESGSVSWMFSRKGVILLAAADNPSLENPETELILIDAGAEEIEKSEDGATIYTPPERRTLTVEALKKSGFMVADSYETFIPITPGENIDQRDLARTEALIEKLEEHDDIETVSSNI